MKLFTVNVIEFLNNDIISIRSYKDDKEGNKEAEYLFDDILKEHGIIDCGYRYDHMDEGYYQDDNGYKVCLSHSM